MQYAELETRTITELRGMARDMALPGHTTLKKQELIFRLLQAQTERQGHLFSNGVLEIMDEGYGMLRQGKSWLPGQEDIYVSQTQIRRFGLRTGDLVTGQIRPPKDSEKFYGLLRIEAVNNQAPDEAKLRRRFDSLTAIFPNKLFDLELGEATTTRELKQHNMSNRVINLVSPIGRGQRGLIVSPPKAGKTLLLKGIAQGITTNCPEAHVMVALIGERPEEVTDWERTVNAEVISSTFDEPPDNHTRVAEMCLERAKRLVEVGHDVVILLDSITRLTRAYNLAVPASGRTLSGGVDPAALYPSKGFYGAGRNIDEGGSLTLLATCLVNTESRMDDVIYEEFKGTGNMELILDRRLADRRVFPAIDIARSGTRREELLLDDQTLRSVITIRRMLNAMGGSDAVEAMLAQMSKAATNREFLTTIGKEVG